MMMHALRVAGIAPIVLAAALASSASAHEFVASKTGAAKVRSTTAQVFEVDATTVECAKASASFEVTATKSKTLAVHKLEYKECSGFGETLDVSAGSYVFEAEDLLSFAKALTISSESGCSIVLEAGANNNREVVHYTNSAGKLRAKQELRSLSYSGSGGMCGIGGSEGKLSGSLEFELEGGTLEWR
jgi:hypothetical protein